MLFLLGLTPFHPLLEVDGIEQCSVVPAVFINMGVILNFMKLLLKVL